MGQNLTGQTVSSTYQDLVQISGSVFTDGLGNNITSVDVTASYATTALSSSYALTASFALNGGGSTVDTGSLITTASISDATITFTKGDASTFNLTVNNVAYAGTAGFADQSGTSGFASQAGTAGFADQAGTSGFATSASWADQSGTSGFASQAGTAGFADQAGTSGYAVESGTSGFAVSSSWADQSGTSGYATNALSSSYALTASYLEGAVDAFPYTGSASITGSLHVTGSQTGILADNEEYKIFTKQVSNSTSPNIFIGAQDPSMNGLNTPAGINNVVIGTGEFTSDIKGLGSGADDSNTLIGGWGGVIWNGAYNTIVGGGQNTMAYQGDTGTSTQTQYNTIVGGTGATIARGAYNAIIGGNSNSILSGSETTPAYNGIFVGQTANITGTDNAQIIGGVTNTITNGDRSIILGGSSNDITFGAGTTANSAILAGTGNDVTHQRSVVIGGSGLASTKNDEVVVPNLTLSGSGNVLTFPDGTTQSTAGGSPFPYAGNALISGSLTVTGSITQFPAINLTRGGFDNTTAIFGSVATIGWTNTNNSVFGLTIGRDNSNGAAGNTHYIIGANNSTNAGSERNFIAGFNNSYTGGNYSTILGYSIAASLGQGMAAVGYDHTVAANYAGAFGGFQGNASHAYSVTVGGANLATRKAYEVVVPNLRTSGSVEVSGSLYGVVSSLGITSQTASLDCSTGNFFTLQLVGGVDTHIAPTNIQAGQTINIEVATTGSGTVSFPPSIKEVSGSSYIPTATDGVDILTLVAFNTSTMYLTSVKNLI
jgi:hypothetical protein